MKYLIALLFLTFIIALSRAQTPAPAANMVLEGRVVSKNEGGLIIEVKYQAPAGNAMSEHGQGFIGATPRVIPAVPATHKGLRYVNDGTYFLPDYPGSAKLADNDRISIVVKPVEATYKYEAYGSAHTVHVYSFVSQ